MNRDTIFVYTAGTNSVTFAYKSPLWITSITGASGNDVAVSESQGAGQVGSTISNQSVQPRDITINGAVLAAVEANRRGILACVLPGVTGRLTVIQNGESWYIDGAPKRTPEFSDGSVVQDFQFVLHCPYPYWRSTADGSAQVAGLTKLFQFPCSLAGTWYIGSREKNIREQILTGDCSTRESAGLYEEPISPDGGFSDRTQARHHLPAVPQTGERGRNSRL